MNQNTLEGGGQLRSDRPRTKTIFSKVLAGIVASVMALAGLVAIGPAAYADPTGISTSVLYNGQALEDGTVVSQGDTLTITTQYTNEVEDGSTVVIGIPTGVTIDESTLEVPSNNTAIESITQVGDEIHLTFVDPFPEDVQQGVHSFKFTFDSVEHTESQTIEWTVGPTEYSRDIIVTTEDAEKENVSDHLSKSVQDLNLNEFVSVDRGLVNIDDAILDETFEYTLQINTDGDTDRTGFTIHDKISEHLQFDEGSFEAEIKTWDDIGWNSTTETFPFVPQISGNEFTYSGDIESPSELTVTYTASLVPNQLEALTEELQAQYDVVEGTGSFSVGLSNEVLFGDGTTDETTVDFGGTREEGDDPVQVDDLLEKNAENTDLDQFVSYDNSGRVVIDDAILDHEINYTLDVHTANDAIRDGFSIDDEISKYLAYNEDSFQAELTTWDEDGYYEETNDFNFAPTFGTISFSYTGDLPSPSKLSVTYTASVDENMLQELQEELQERFDALEDGSTDYRVSLTNKVSFENEHEREANVSIGGDLDDGVGPEGVEDYLAKSVGDADLSQYVRVHEGQVQVDESILDLSIDYTLNVNTHRETDRQDYTIEDEISEFLAYDEDSFEAEITTWDNNGWNKETNPFPFDPTVSGNSFSFTGDIANPSELTIWYSAFVDADQLDALTAALQEEFDKLDAGHGGFGMELPNTATFGGDIEREGHVNIDGHLEEPPVPSADEAFDKTSDISSMNINPAEDGALDPALDVTYTFEVNLSQWDGQPADGYLNSDDFTLDRNVVISDNLPEQAQWNVADDDFITGMNLDEATGFDGDANEFAADNYIGQYAVVGQNLFINVGADSETKNKISVKALITTVDGLTSTSDDGIERFELDNNAQFIFSNDAEPYGSSVTVTLHDRGDGVLDENKFSKSAVDGDKPIYIAPGESATMDYRFEINQDWSNAVDITQSYIVDKRDPNIFDFSDLEETVESISGTLHNNAAQFDASHFDLSVNADGNLVIALNDVGIALVDDSWAEPTAPFVVDLALNTQPVTGKQTLTIENNATLYGSEDEALYWSETTSEASSYGDEAEVRKSIRDTPNETWTQNLRAEVEDGELVQDEYVYNLAFIPHGNYSGVTIIPVEDQLPEEVEFLGFVTDDNVDSGENPESGPIDIGGNLEAVYDEEAHTITVQSQEGQLLTQETNIHANVLVRVTEFEEDVPVINIFGKSSTTITPSDGYPLSIAKIDSEDDEVVINDRGSRFTVLDADDNIVIDNAFVENGQLRVEKDTGETTGLVVREPGTYYVEEKVAPAGYKLSTERIQVTVGQDGSSEQVTFSNDPVEEPAVSIIKGDGNAEDGTIDNDADTEEEAVAYEDGETRDIVINVTNTGDEDLVDVVLTDETVSGAAIESLVWTTPDGEELDAADVDGVLTATWDGPWAPNDVITGVATLTLTEGEELHTNVASVEAVGAGSGQTVEDDDPYNGTPPEPVDPPTPNINVIKNDEGDDQHEVEAGEHDVVVVITNDGEEALENFEFNDTTESGHDVVWNEEDLAGLTDLVLEVGESYTVNGVVQVDAGENHRDNVVVNATGVISGEPVDDEDPTTYVAPDPETYAIGDYVWIDANSDGIQDEDEEPLADVTVVLFDGTGNEIDRTETNGEGRYIFDNLEAGDYQVRFILTDEQAAIYEFTDDLAGEDVKVDSDAGYNGFSSIITLGADNAYLITGDEYEHFTVEATEGIDPTWDAGVVLLPEPEEPTYAIGDYVWIDSNRDGIQDDDESPLNDVTVVLYDGDGEELERTTTNHAGRYIFDNLPAGEYQVGFELTEEQAERYEFTDYTEGEDPAEDSDAGENGRSEVFTLGEGSPLVSNDDYEHNTVQATEGIDPTWDAGVVEKTYAIGDYVWVDSNRDGLQDEDEDPLSDVTVVLYDGEGEELDRTTTDEYGRYIFDNLPSGDYQVGFELTEEQERQYNFTDYTEGDDPAADSNAGENGRSEVFTLGPDSPLVSNDDYEHFEVEASEGIDPTWDAGVQLKPYAIGDYVWIDSNRDGIQDDDEEPLEGVTVILYDGDTNEIERTTTDENGRYIFDYLNAGDYEVRFILTEEQAELYEFTKLRAGSDSRVDSNAGYMGFSGVFTLGPDNQNLTLDYDEQEFGAPLGIDPTWDAGVVLIPEEEPVDPTPTPTGPTDPEEPTESGTPTDPADPEEPTESGTPAEPADPSDQETPGDEEDELSRTGANFALLFGALGLILLLTGGALYARHRNGNEA